MKTEIGWSGIAGLSLYDKNNMLHSFGYSAKANSHVAYKCLDVNYRLGLRLYGGVIGNAG
jgi:hypothetical protein